MLGKNRARERMDELLSAYIDGALSPRERARLEAQLAQDADLRARLESLQRTVTLVRGMPPVRAPRNFLLTPAMVRRPVPMARRLAPALTFATAISGLLCVILLVGNLLTAGWGRMGATAPAPMAAYEESPQVLDTEAMEAKKAPPVSETVPPEEGLLSSAATASETPVPEMRAWSEETPSPIEGAPSPPDMGGMGGGAAPGLPPGAPPEPGEEVPPTPTPEMPPQEMAGAAVEEATPLAVLPAQPTPAPPPLEMPGGKGTLPLTSWLPVGGLALLTAVLAFLSLRAWRAR